MNSHAPDNDGSNSNDLCFGHADGKCHLLSLPAELRNRIHEYVVPEKESWRDSGICIDTRTGRMQHSKKFPALLETCHQIRTEALIILLETITFVFLERHPGQISFGWFTPYIKHIKHLQFHTFHRDHPPGFARLDMPQGLESYVLKRTSIPLPKSRCLLNEIIIRGEMEGRVPSLDACGLRFAVWGACGGCGECVRGLSVPGSSRGGEGRIVLGEVRC